MTTRNANDWAPMKQNFVWVTGYPRSSTSTILSMISGGDPNSSRVFSLFEPCHPWDEYESKLKENGCGGVLRHVAHCDFTGISKLWGWAEPHSSSRGAHYSPEVAKNHCSDSEIVAVKTVGTVKFDHRLKNWLYLLDEMPRMKILNVVRDPRGIYASWKATPEFTFLTEQYGIDVYMGICQAFAANLDVQHSRVHTIVFEELVQTPINITKGAYSFLGLEYADETAGRWLKRTFDARDCPPTPSWQENFTDCHVNSVSHAEGWRTALSTAEKQAFLDNADCRRVAEAYGYPLE